MNTVEIIEADQAVPAIMPMDLIERAITNGASVEVMEKLMGLYERAEANRARRAFDAAMADAKSEIQVIPKSRQAHHYRYEDIGDVHDAIAPALGKHGLHYRYETDNPPGSGWIAVTCIVSHRDGHSVKATLSTNYEIGKNMNASQAVGSACTYLQRYTLKAALGLAAAVDDDAQSAGNVRKPPPENEDEFAKRWKLIIDTATDDVELENQWRAEADLRLMMIWRRKDPKVIYEAMRRRQTELVAAEEAREASLATQRLKAEDA